MKDKLYRENIAKGISAPEKMNEYIKIIRFHVWPVVLVTILVLTGIIVLMDHLENSLYVFTAGEAHNGILTCYIQESDYKNVMSLKNELAVILTEKKNTDNTDKVYGAEKLVEIADKPVELDETYDSYLIHASGFYGFEWVYTACWQTDLPDGVYKVMIFRDGDVH